MDWSTAFEGLNYWAVLGAAAGSYALGAFWYSQAVFGKKWMKLVGLKEKDNKNAKMGPLMGGTAILTFISALVLAALMHNVSGLYDGIVFGGMIGAGLVATNKGVHFLFSQKPQELFVIDATQDILSFMVMGGILGVWN